MSGNDGFVQAGRERKASALIVTLLNRAPVPTPDVVDRIDRDGWLILAELAQIRPPSEETVALTRDRYRKVYELHHRDERS